MSVFVRRRMLSAHQGQFMELVRVVQFTDEKGTPIALRYETSNGLQLKAEDLVFTDSQEEQDELAAMTMNAKLVPQTVDFIPGTRVRRRIY